MKFLYNIALYCAEFLLKILALFNHKIRLGVEGRRSTFNVLKEQLASSDRTFWFHCASLGEYEQGLPVFTEIRRDYPNHKIILTFFSPSGYEIRKNSPVADIVVYLPLDTPTNAKRFIRILKPELSIFVKYDIWPNYISELKARQLKTLLISAVFRKDQLYFKFYGGILRNALQSFEHIFVQNESSKSLLKTIGITATTVAGDTRYDRVSNQLEQNNTLPFIEQFIDGKLCVVLGSSWPEDEFLFLNYINASKFAALKFIIAPHNIKRQQLEILQQKIETKTVLFSEKEGKDLSEYNVFIVNTIGILSKIYSYADIAYVGGAMGQTGLHNILEPAVFGVPILIGPNYTKFPEAYDMIAHGGVKCISNGKELQKQLTALVSDTSQREHLGNLNADYIKHHKGAVNKIIDYINT